MRRLASWLHCSEGHAYTVVIGTVLAVLLTAFTVPAVINHRPPPAPTPPPFQDLSTADTAAALTIDEGGYATASVAGNLPAVPRRGFPVASLAGSTARVSFVRLSGQARTLHLDVDHGSSLNEAGAGVAVCPIGSETWAPQRALPLAGVPPFSCAAAASAFRGPDGAWTADLGAFGDRAGSAGFALVPRARSGASFQVVFTSP